MAELGAAFLCGHTGILPRTAEDQAAYLSGWLSALKGDKRLLHIAAAQAQKAADFILHTGNFDDAPHSRGGVSIPVVGSYCATHRS